MFRLLSSINVSKDTNFVSDIEQQGVRLSALCAKLEDSSLPLWVLYVGHAITCPIIVIRLLWPGHPKEKRPSWSSCFLISTGALSSLPHSQMCRLHINCTPVVEERDGIVIYVGNFHGSSEFGIIQLCRRLQQNTSGKSSSALYDFSLMTSSSEQE